ncbi:MAG TPA: NAD(P)H-binding protein [Kofleriaceae bacterium]
MSNILVIGSSGMTGRRLLPRLTARGATVRPTRRTAGDGHVRFVWEDPATHAAALANVDAIYLVPPGFVAAPAPIVKPFLAAALTAGVQRVVVCSSLGAEISPGPVRDGWRAFERSVIESELAWTILRPGGFAQNFTEGFLAPGVHQGVVVSATGDGAAAFIDADDIAAVAVEALLDPAHAGATYALTGPAALTFEQATRVVAELAARPIAYRAITSEELRHMLTGFGLPADYAALVVADQEAIRDGRGARISSDVERVLGRSPTSFREAIRDQLHARR